MGIDAVGALEVWPNYPGFQGMNLEPGPYPRLSFTALGRALPKTMPYNYHFPDGNASIARAAGAIAGAWPPAGPHRRRHRHWRISITASSTGRQSIRIRLSSTVLRARHVGDPATAKEVEVVYGRDKEALFGAREIGSPGLLEHDDSVSVPGACRRSKKKR